MFNTPRPNLIESSDGFSVEVLGRTGLRYVDGNKVLKIDSEVLARPVNLVIYSDSIRKWAPPHQDEVIDDRMRRQIVENVCEAFRFTGFEIEVQ